MNTNIILAASHYWSGIGTGPNNIRPWMQHPLSVEDVADASHPASSHCVTRQSLDEWSLRSHCCAVDI